MEEVRGSRAPVLFARNGFMEYDMSVCSPHSPLSACMSIALNPFRANRTGRRFVDSLKSVWWGGSNYEGREHVQGTCMLLFSLVR
jgi:hypothetical protein